MDPVILPEQDHFSSPSVADSLGSSLRNAAIIALATLQIVGVLGCSTQKSVTEADLAAKEVAERVERLSKVKDYGNGVYSFECIGEEFLKTLSDFIEAHPELEVVSTVTGSDGQYGAYDYVVVTRPVVQNTVQGSR